MMPARPRLLDLFCGAGGAAVGYFRAGFDIVGVDSVCQPRYPFEFVQGDAMEYVAEYGHRYDLIHASPPCQRYTVGRHIHASGGRHPDLVSACRAALIASGRPWVIENVIGSPLVQPVTLCGLMFGLGVLRHRLFESSAVLFAPPHPRHPAHLTTGTLTAKRGGRGNGYSTGAHGLVCVAGNNFVREAGARAMGIDWPMTRRELANAIPPAYAEWIGRQLIARLDHQTQPTEAA
jgi:DNA (cytosine-5)-methyltransferase 1